MIIKNISRKTEIENVVLAKSPFSKLKGLMFKKSGRLLMKHYISSRHGVWMPFMKFHLDLIFIDKNKNIVDIKHNVPPISLNPKTWKIYFPGKNSLYVLEIEAGLARKAKFLEGDKLSFNI